jgi:site-specific DNA-methyltransferase (adenine-specific)
MCDGFIIFRIWILFINQFIYKGAIMKIEEMINKIFLETPNKFEFVKEIPDKSIDMILCDLPYGTTACKWDIIIPFDLLWSQYNRIIKDGCAIVLTAAQPFTSALKMSNIKMFKYEWVWDKHIPRGFQIAKYRPMQKHENILVFGNGDRKSVE